MISRGRRRFVQGIGAAGLAMVVGCSLPFTAPPPRVRRIARLAGTQPNPATDALTVVFRQALADLGYMEGQNLIIDERYANGDEALAEPAAEMVGLQAEVIVVPSYSGARAVQSVTTTIPIVCAGQGDLVANGVVASLARPGGNITGLSTPILVSKPLQLLQDSVPTISRVTILLDATSPATSREPYEVAARTLGLQLRFALAGRDELETLFETAVSERADALFVATGPGIAFNQVRIADLALKSRLPTMWGLSDAVSRGGLMGYGANRADLNRRSASYVDRILKGAKPVDLPVEQPESFDFVINVKTAQSLGLTIPPVVLAQATEVIQ